MASPCIAPSWRSLRKRGLENLQIHPVPPVGLEQPGWAQACGGRAGWPPGRMRRDRSPGLLCTCRGHARWNVPGRKASRPSKDLPGPARSTHLGEGQGEDLRTSRRNSSRFRKFWAFYYRRSAFHPTSSLRRKTKIGEFPAPTTTLLGDGAIRWEQHGAWFLFSRPFFWPYTPLLLLRAVHGSPLLLRGHLALILGLTLSVGARYITNPAGRVCCRRHEDRVGPGCPARDQPSETNQSWNASKRAPAGCGAGRARARDAPLERWCSGGVVVFLRARRPRAVLPADLENLEELVGPLRKVPVP